MVRVLAIAWHTAPMPTSAAITMMWSIATSSLHAANAVRVHRFLAPALKPGAHLVRGDDKTGDQGKERR
jgi:hypothetical protein